MLNILNLVTGEENHFLLGDPYTQAGFVAWSPDGSRVVLSARSGEDCYELIYYLIMIDLDDYQQTVLLQGSDMNFFPQRWTWDNRLILQHGYGEYGDAYFTYNLASGELLPNMTSTPTPTP